MTTEYTNITILDCNRLHSIQARSGNDTNKALFTNELGEGIKLKVGDKVSVKGAYISEVGAGADTVELKGSSLGKRRKIPYTLEEPAFPTTLGDTYDNDTQALPLITPFQEYTVSASELEYDIKDNETYITIQYYLNNSGDSGYISLPRRFASVSASETIDNATYTSLDSLAEGRPYQEVIDGQFVSDDYMYYDNSVNGNNTGFYKLRTDCSRYTLMKRIGTTKLRRETVKNTGNQDNDFPPRFDYIMGSQYTIYKQYINIKARAGFNSPTSISDQINDQLKEASEPYNFKVRYQGVDKAVSQYYTTETFKPQICGSNFTMAEKQFDSFTFDRDDGSIAIEERKESAWAYWSNFMNVYHKRPEIREAGQGVNNLWGSNLHNRSSIAVADRTTSEIVLSLEYTDAHLLHFKKLFDAQETYPELFSNDNAQAINPPFDSTNTKLSVDNARYLHMNTQYSATRNASLGGDNIEYDRRATNQQSIPLFFYFQKENKDKLTDGTDDRDLSYGFASKRKIGSTHYIVLHPEKIGGINAGLFKNVSGSDTPLLSGTILGYDHNYNAYGTSCLMGYSGRLRYDYSHINEWGTGDINLAIQSKSASNPLSLSTAEYMRLNYVGSNNPKFKYDPDNSRFYFSELHTPELAGQEWAGAGDSGSGVSPEIEANPPQNAGAEVYKINKRIEPYSYTPDMKPYTYNFSVSYKDGDGKGSVIKRDISQPNRSISPWSIFDSQSGIFISDFGYDEDEWNNGLWGILGFSYDQFNKTLTSTNNRQSRIINSNINNLNIPTTNAQIVSSDTRAFIVNQFGALYYTTQLPSSSTLIDQDFLPAITNNAFSIRLSAVNLPRKMLRPYYCIRSDIIDSPHYIGGENSNNRLGVVSVCDKQYSGGDFYFSEGGDFVFTITKDKTITNITTSIHDPDQSFSRVNSDSAVIYKIESQIVNEIDLAQQILQGLKKK